MADGKNSEVNVSVDVVSAVLVFFWMAWVFDALERIDCALGMQKACSYVAIWDGKRKPK